MVNVPVAYCIDCGKPVPDSFHDFKEICSCFPKEHFIEQAKKMHWKIRIDKKVYDFTEK